MNDYLLESKNIRKEFPGVVALDGVSFNLKPGEVHALLGENGAGKSTMMKIFSGVYQKNSGDIYLKGKEVTIASPIQAAKLGIGIIYQELNLCPHLSVAENIFLSREFLNGIRLDREKMESESLKILSVLHSDIDPKEKVKNLSISKQQIVEIAKALSQNADIIIMDEPTSSLSEREVAQLFEVIKELKKRGKGIIYISHKLDELKEIVDRVTIFRDGKWIKTAMFSELTLDEIISYMVGRSIDEKFPRLDTEIKTRRILELKNFSKGEYFKNINLELFEGEVLGIAGLVGAGRTELCKGIFGAYGKCSGEISIDDKKVEIKSPIDAIKNGISYIAEDRKKEGLAINMSVSQNMSFPILDMISSKIIGYIDKGKLVEKSNSMIEKLSIKTPSISQKVKNLSGGNQQKIVIGKWILKNPKVIIFDEPTRGIDVNAKIEIYKIINELKANGIGVVVISSELPEILGITDRIVVMCNKSIRANLETRKTNQEEIMNFATKFND
ncbi:sugar ABC transporter ATP-binding protein [uncultured Cetobacterium sp.]|uniref:sugar ABC transporter ATP-binding protein n=1 Tax=uncultured Cetobacterium sp. TaxID=527638 RepID=UPI0026133D06|nr:sugar ABC transporter ATP-binding protein [uncultured Cetobacterium sp.]